MNSYPRTGKPVKDRHFEDINLQGLNAEDRDAELITWKDPGVYLPKIPPVLRHLFGRIVSQQDEQLFPGVAMSVAWKSERAEVICHKLRPTWAIREGMRNAEGK